MSVSFFDSNVILYLALSSSDKSLRASRLMAHGGFIKVQVLNECTNVLRTKQGRHWHDVRDFLTGLCTRFQIEPITIAIHCSGIRLAERYGFSVYDSFIVSAALAAGCDTLWSEDMQDGLVVDNRLTIVNPFRLATPSP